MPREIEGGGGAWCCVLEVVVLIVVVVVVVVADEDKGAMLEVDEEEEFDAAGALFSALEGCDGGLGGGCDKDEEALAAAAEVSAAEEGLLTPGSVADADKEGAFVSRNRLPGSCAYCLGELGAVEVGVECIER